MPEENKTPQTNPNSDQKTTCSFCGNTSFDKVLLHGLHHEKPVMVCTSCLPRLIHG